MQHHACMKYCIFGDCKTPKGECLEVDNSVVIEQGYLSLPDHGDYQQAGYSADRREKDNDDKRLGRILTNNYGEHQDLSPEKF